MRFFLGLWAIGTFLFPAFAQVPVPPEIAARSYLLMDVSANQVLATKDSDEPVEPASLTKLMTAYLVFDALRQGKLKLDQALPVSDRAWRMPGSRMFIDPKMQVPVEDLIKGMIVQSGNDATMALAEAVGGTAERFVEMMNAQAVVLGMRATSYRNPEGLTQAGHITTARDLSVLAVRLMRDFPNFADYYAIKKYRYPGTPAANDNNRNLLLFRDPTVDGLKTGYTDAAGYCLVATAKRDWPQLGQGAKRRLLSIVLGAVNENVRANESQKLLNWGFSAYDAVKLFDAQQIVAQTQVWKGEHKIAKLGRPDAVVVAVPNGTGNRLKTQVVRSEPLIAPVMQGQQIGTLNIFAGDHKFVEVPLWALEEVGQAGPLGRAWDALRLWLQ